MSGSFKTFTSVMDDIQNQIFEMGKIVEKQLLLSVDALVLNQKNKVEDVLELDKIVDQYEHEIHSSILHLINIQQPLPNELQALTTMIRISREFERIGDQAVNIADLCKSTEVKVDSEIIKRLNEMCSCTRSMLLESIEALKNKDINQAKLIAKRDDKINQYFDDNQIIITQEMVKEPNRIASLANLLLVNRYLERCADHVVNVTRQVEKSMY